jgi:hypothetical protein
MGGATPLLGLAACQLLNLRPDDILALPGRLTREYGIAADVVAAAVSHFSVQTLGYAHLSPGNFLPEFPLIQSCSFLVPSIIHFRKLQRLLGLGAENLINVSVDLDGRVEIGLIVPRVRCPHAHVNDRIGSEILGAVAFKQLDHFVIRYGPAWLITRESRARCR